MRARVLGVLVAGTVMLFVGCGKKTDAEREARLAAMTPQERQIQAVLDERCVKCHMPPNPGGKVELTEPRHLLPLINSARLYDDIAVYRMLMGDSTVAEHAPAKYQLQQSEIDLIRQWVLTEHREILPDTTASDSAAAAGVTSR